MDDLIRSKMHEALDVEQPTSDLRSRVLSSLPANERLEPRRKSRVVHIGRHTELAAGVAAAVLAAMIIATFAYIRAVAPPVTSAPAPQAPLGPFAVSQPIVVAPPFVLDCPVSTNSFACGMQAPVFATANVGWLTAGYLGETDLYRTEDAGRHWKALLGWMGPPPRDIKASSDGSEALVVIPQPPNRNGLLHTTDAGAHWTSSGFPLCGTKDCSQWIYFLNAHEGWVMQPGPAPDIEELYRTVDSGIHWTLQSSFSVSSEFPGQQLTGYLVFQSSSHGWFLPVSVSANTWLIYQTTDGGKTWHRHPISANPSGSTPVIPTAFNDQAGLVRFQGGTGSYISTTSDGGVTWSRPLAIPIGGSCGAGPCGADFVDDRDWIGVGNGGLLLTTDAGQDWTVLSDIGPFAGNIGTTTPGCCWFDFVDVAHGWNVGAAADGTAVLFGTTDGGITWNRLSLPLAAVAPFAP